MVSISAQEMKVIAAADSFGAPLKDALVDYLKACNIVVEDLGIAEYYNAGAEVGKRVADSLKSGANGQEIRGLCVCGTGVGVSIFANKFAGVYAAACDSVDEAKNCRSINNSNVLAVGAKVTPVDEGKKILDTWLRTPFKAPCPFTDEKPWPEEIQSFLDNSIEAMAKIPQAVSGNGERSGDGCQLCNLAAKRDFVPVDIMPGGSMSIVRQDPTSAIVRFKAGSLEPAHHHTFGHDLIVTYGNKRVWNLTNRQVFNLGPGDFLYTPAGDIHRVQYFTDTEFFIKWDGHWDIFFDEDLVAASAAVENSETEKLD